MAESIVKVIVTDQVGKTVTEKANVGVKGSQIASNKKVSSSVKKSVKALAGVAMVAKATGSMLMSNVGNFTGDSILQTQVNNTLEGFKTIGMFALSPTAAVISTTLNIANTMITKTHQRRMESLSLANALARNGYDASDIRWSRRH